MKRITTITIILLASTICSFGQFNGGNVNDVTSKIFRYDSIRTVTDPKDCLPLWMAQELIVGYVSKGTVNAATTGNITLSGNQTIDAYSATGDDTILVKDQILPEENGVYFVGIPWIRATYMDTWDSIYKSSVLVIGGTVNVNSTFSSYMDATGTLEVDTILWNLTSKMPDMTGYRNSDLNFERGRVNLTQGTWKDSTDVLFTEGDIYETIPGIEISGTGNPINGDMVFDLTTGYELSTEAQLNKLDSLPYSIGNWTGMFDSHEGSYYLAYENLTGKPTIPTISNAAYDVAWATDYIGGASRASLYAKIQTLGVAAHSLSTGHTDVLTSSIAKNNLLQWNGSKWTNVTLVQAGIQASGTYVDRVSDLNIGDNQTVILYSGLSNPVVVGTIDFDTASSYNGMMSIYDEQKLNGIEDSAEVNVNADWDETDTTDAFIYGKPDVIVKGDTARDATEPIMTRHLADSLYATSSEGSLWTVSDNGDTTLQNTNVVRIDTVVMGQDESYLPINIAYRVFPTKSIYNGTSAAVDDSVYKYCMNESGLIRYKLHLAPGGIKYLARSTDSGVTWTNLKTITYSSLSRCALKCSNLGDVVAFTDFPSSIVTLNVSRNYGNVGSFTSVGIGTNGVCGALDISDDGTLIGVVGSTGAGVETVYIYRDAIEAQCVNPVSSAWDIKVANDSTIYLLAGVLADSNNRNLYEITPSGTISVIYPHAYRAASFDYEGNTVYLSDSTKIWKSVNGAAFAVLKDLATIKVFNVSVSKDGSYMYCYVNNGAYRILRSTDSGVSFSQILTEAGSSENTIYDYIEMNEGVSYDQVKYYWKDGRMYYASGGPSAAPDYNPVNGKDFVTLDYYQASSAGQADITGVNTPTNSGMGGGTTTGEANLYLDINNLDWVSDSDIGDLDYLCVADADNNYQTRRIPAGNMKVYFGGGGTVTSFSAGALSPLFTTTVTNPNTTPALGFTLTSSVPQYYVFGRINSGTGAPSFIEVNDALIPNTITCSNYLPLSGLSSMTGKLTTMTGTTSSAPLNIPSGNAPTSPVDGDIWKTPLGLYVRVGTTTVGPLGTGSGGGSTIDPYDVLTISGSTFTWDRDVSGLNVKLTMTTNSTINISNLNDGEDAAILRVIPHATQDYTLQFPAYFHCNGRPTNYYNIEHGTHRYKFTFESDGTDIFVDYATYGN